MNSNFEYIIGAILAAVLTAAIYVFSFIGQWLVSL